jgi:uncharacterized protein YdeI (YjbR/CyaY-like superfamily)
MPKRDPKVDAYLAHAAPFAKPILRRLRKVVHAGCPAVEETIKWGFPHFVYKGNIAGMAAFKEHCVFGFWKDALLFKRDEETGKKEGMGQFGRLTHVSDLPDEATLVGYVRKAAELNDQGVSAGRTRQARPPLPLPPDFAAALAANTEAKKTFNDFPPGKRREYIAWVTEAKRPETRRRRLATSIEWLAQGKSQSWKYEQKPA